MIHHFIHILNGERNPPLNLTYDKYLATTFREQSSIPRLIPPALPSLLGRHQANLWWIDRRSPVSHRRCRDMSNESRIALWHSRLCHRGEPWWFVPALQLSWTTHQGGRCVICALLWWEGKSRLGMRMPFGHAIFWTLSRRGPAEDTSICQYTKWR